MRLISLRLGNFKGIAKFEVQPDGHDLSIYGQNGAGKTTLADALTWLLFGKDSQNRADFEIKTLNADGSAKHKLNHEVEATFDLDGKRITLRKVYTENWVKARGSVDAEFSGHTTDHFVDGVPLQKKEYDARIAAICPESRFRLLADAYHFNQNLSWQERRRVLIDAFGDVSDADVIASNSKLKDLPAILGARSLDDYRKILLARRPELNKQIEMIPVRIDEISRSLADVPEASIDTAELDKALSDLRAERSEVAAGGVGELAAQLSDAKSALLDVEHAIREAADASQAGARQASQEHADKVAATTRSLRTLEVDLAGLERSAKDIEPRLAYLRAEHAALSARVWAGDETCGACGQALPAAKIEAAKEAFNKRRASDLEANIERGKSLKVELDRVTADIAAKQSEIADRKAELSQLEASVPPVPATEAVDYSADETWRAAKEKVGGLELQIEGVRSGNQEALAKLDERIRTANEALLEVGRTNALIAAAKQSHRRIEELEAEHKTLAEEAEKIAREIWLSEEFIRAKVSMLTDRINSRFAIARFKLFETQVNQGINEVCDLMVGGVPYGSLNHGMRLNAGLDVINTLANHWGFAPVVFIDNAESVTSILPTLGQQVRLVVSESDPKLRVEVATEKETVAA